MSRRILIFEPVPNAHRMPILRDLCATLLEAGWDLHLLVEAGQIIRIGWRIRTWTFPEHRVLVDALGSRCTVLDVFRAASRPQDADIAAADARRAALLAELLDAEPEPDLVLLYNGSFHFQQIFLAEMRRRGWIDRCRFLEVGWFTQRDAVQISRHGVNARSDLSGLRPEPVTEAQQAVLEVWRARYLLSRLGTQRRSRQPGQPGRLLVPLQVDTDTAVQDSSPFKSMRDFITHLEEFVPAGWEVVIKSHPKASYDYHLASRRPDFRFAASGSIYDYLREADLVIGLNSTVLMEAALAGLPIVAFGQGVFTGNGVLHELGPEDGFPEHVAVDATARDAFFYQLVFQRQIDLAALGRRDCAHLSARFPFNQYDPPTRHLSAIRRIHAEEGRAVIRIGVSKVARTASLDVAAGGRIEIGDGCEIRHHAVLEVIGRYNGVIKIGHNCVIGICNWLQGSGNITIGDDVIIGPYTCIISSDHIHDDPDVPIARQPLRLGAVVIEDDVWLGANVTVTRGIRIGAHSIIGANTFVNADVPPYSVVVGSPGRVIRSRKPAPDPA